MKSQWNNRYKFGSSGKGSPRNFGFFRSQPTRKNLENFWEKLENWKFFEKLTFQKKISEHENFTSPFKKRTALTGSRTRAARLEGENTNRYTISAVTFMQSVFFVGDDFTRKII